MYSIHAGSHGETWLKDVRSDLTDALYKRLPEGIFGGAIAGAIGSTALALYFDLDASKDPSIWLMIAMVMAGSVAGSYAGAAWGFFRACFDALKSRPKQ